MAEADEIIFSDGQAAFDAGEGPQTCPHAAGSRAQRFWLAGWDEARRYAERCQGQEERSVVLPFLGRASVRGSANGPQT